MDLSNQQNWLLLIDQSKEVTDVSEHWLYSRKYVPLQPTEVNCSSPVLMITLDSSDASGSWIKGGWASFFAQINGLNSLIGKHNLRLYENNLITFPYYGEEVVPFNLRIEYPWWIKNVRTKIWEFQDSSGKYSSLENSNLERKIDLLVERDVRKTYNVILED